MTRRPPPGKRALPKPEVEDFHGLECPRCGCRWVPVLYTRPAPAHRLRRVRECHHCGRRFSTFEKALDDEPGRRPRELEPTRPGT
jgi:hypothetical protein